MNGVYGELATVTLFLLSGYYRYGFTLAIVMDFEESLFRTDTLYRLAINIELTGRGH